jgi:hypothetical protein
MATFLKSILNSKTELAEEFLSKFKKKQKTSYIPSPLNLRIGCVVEFDNSAFLAIEDSMQVVMPESAMVIEAYGSIDFGGGVIAHRFYDADGQLLEIITQVGENIEEVRFFVPFDSIYPESEEEWDFWIGDDGLIGYPTFMTKEGTEYLRLWFQNSEDRVEPVDLEENIITPVFNDTSVCVDYHCMSYGRYIANTDRVEYLFVSFENTGNEASIELMLGVDISKTDIQVI